MSIITVDNVGIEFIKEKISEVYNLYATSYSVYNQISQASFGAVRAEVTSSIQDLSRFAPCNFLVVLDRCNGVDFDYSSIRQCDNLILCTFGDD